MLTRHHQCFIETEGAHLTFDDDECGRMHGICYLSQIPRRGFRNFSSHSGPRDHLLWHSVLMAPGKHLKKCSPSETSLPLFHTFLGSQGSKGLGL